jgi:hypothetical protein
MTELDLSNNLKLGPDGARAISDAIAAGKFPSLKILHIRTNTSIGASGSVALIAAKKKTGRPSSIH